MIVGIPRNDLPHPRETSPLLPMRDSGGLSKSYLGNAAVSRAVGKLANNVSQLVNQTARLGTCGFSTGLQQFKFYGWPKPGLPTDETPGQATYYDTQGTPRYYWDYMLCLSWSGGVLGTSLTPIALPYVLRGSTLEYYSVGDGVDDTGWNPADDGNMIIWPPYYALAFIMYVGPA